MSDIQELIHRTTMIAYAQGMATERERISKLIRLETFEPSESNPHPSYDILVVEGVREQLLELINGDKN